MAGRRIEILVRREGQPERRVTLEQGTYLVGRAEDSALVLPDIAVSRRHARITVTLAHVLVEDIGSSNGTYVRGRPIRRQEVADADEVLIDPFVLVFSVPPAPDLPEDAHPVEAGPRLDVLAGPGMRATYPLSGIGLTLGRSEQRDVVLADPAASRRHAEVFQQDGRWYLRDFGSINGTWVNDQRIREHALQDGDRIRIGSVEMRFVDPAPGSVAPSPRPLASVVFTDPALGRPGGGAQLPPGAVVPPTAVALGIAEPPITSTPLPLRPSPAAGGSEASGVPDGLQPTAAIPRAAILAGAVVAPGSGSVPGDDTRPEIGSDPLPFFQAPTAPPPDTDPGEPPSTRPATYPSGAGGGTGEATIANLRGGRTGDRAGQTSFRTGEHGPSMDRTIRRLTIGIGVLAALLIAYKVIRDAQEGSNPTISPPGAFATRGESPEAPSSDNAVVGDLIEQGDRLFREKRYVEAIERYAAVQNLDPQNARAVKMGYHACEFLVIRTLREEVARRSTSQNQRRAAYEQAVAEARAALAGTGPETADAIEDLETIRSFFPEDAVLLELLDQLHATRRGDVEAQRRQEQETLASGASDRFASAEKLEKDGDLLAAIRAYEAVLAADPHRRTAFPARAEERIRVAKATLAARGQDALRQGLGALEVGDPLTARSRFRECLEQDPYNAVAARRLKEVQDTLDRSAQTYWMEAEVYERSDQLELAIARYHKVIEVSASSAAPLAQKAKVRIDALLQ
ncbi:MAG: FHA domain-containing protein [Deltaproteobacteria bacterium]|nr:FHA domain-containing protein [Deltaproteobacteria bacterium]